MIRYIVVIKLLFFCAICSAQTYKFHHFTFEEGLQDLFVYNIAQDNNSYLLVATSEGLAKYDGVSFQTISKDQGLADNFISEMVVVGGTTWLGHNNGALSIIKETGEVKAIVDSSFQSKVVSIETAKNGDMWVLTQQEGIRIFSKSGKLKDRIIIKGDRLFTDLVLINQTNFILSHDLGVEQFMYTKGGLEVGATLCSDVSVNNMLKHKNSIIMLGDGIMLRLNDIRGLSIDTIQTGVNAYWQGGYVTKLNDILLTSPQGLFKFKIRGSKLDLISAFNESNGLTTSYVTSVYEDKSGTIWVGTYGGGLSMLIDEYFTFYTHGDMNGISVSAILIEDSAKYYAANDSLFKMSTNASNSHENITASSGIPSGKIAKIYRSSKGLLYLGYDGKGLFALGKDGQGNQIKLAKNSLSTIIYDIEEFEDHVAVATENGVYFLKAGRVVKHLSTENGLRHNRVYEIYKDVQTNLWFGSRSNQIYHLSTDWELKEIEIPVRGVLLDVLSLLRVDNKLFIGTANNGVLVKKEDKFTQLDVLEGAGLNYCSALVLDNLNRLWIGHRSGVTRMDLDSEDLETFDKQFGISGDVSLGEIQMDRNFNVWFGTTNALIKFDPHKDQQQLVPPSVEIMSMLLNDKGVQPTKSLDLSHGNYTLAFNLKGISLNNADKIEFQVMLEGFDDDWIRIDQNNVSYKKLPPGNYKFKVKACINNNCSNVLESAEVYIDKPYYQKWWFYVTVVLFVGALTGAIVLLRVRRLKKVQQYLQFNLDIRTKEVVKQKEIIEEKNRDITDSIEYAKRIQTSIMPLDEELKELYPDSFIFFKPRDIVSGDFYWFKELEDRVVVAVADCTGHGVPGAFMSMIGTSALRHILTTSPDLQPDAMLRGLDVEITQVLRQIEYKSIDARVASGQVKDGMDITIASIDKVTNNVTIATAMRTAFVYRNQTLEIVKGDRVPIGGALGGEKEFTNHEFELSKGDSIYLFTDGYPDQFGGKNGGKMKISGLMSVLELIASTPMVEQEQIISSHFESWQSNRDQIDDVLFVGIRI